MKTEKHPYSKVIHFGTGGVIDKNGGSFTTLCGKTFKQGHDKIMMSGHWGATHCTCKTCKRILHVRELEDRAREKLRKYLDIEIHNGNALRLVKKLKIRV